MMFGAIALLLRFGAIAILMLLVLVECDRLCGESVDILGDRFLIEIWCDRNFDVVGFGGVRSLVW
jgi:hypothetical protein